jgi:RimJ/RimL family protein N-acetyltransferase
MSKGEIESETGRLELRRFSAGDAPGFFSLNKDPEVIRYTGDVSFADENEARDFILGYNHYSEYGYGRWSVFIKETDEYVGFCGLKYSPEKDEVDLGFRVLRAHWGKGFATEAGRESLRLGFERYGLKKIVGRAMSSNLASHRVLEKLNMVETSQFEENGHAWIQYEIDEHC